MQSKIETASELRGMQLGNGKKRVESIEVAQWPGENVLLSE
jgi:hypothetical protein